MPNILRALKDSGDLNVVTYGMLWAYQNGFTLPELARLAVRFTDCPCTDPECFGYKVFHDSELYVSMDTRTYMPIQKAE